MPVRNRRLRSRPAIETPPKRFPVLIKPHVYRESGLGTCLECGGNTVSSLHIRPHYYERNMDSKLLKCMCGKNRVHSIHKKGTMA